MNAHVSHLSHLSDDQIDDVLIGDLAAEQSSHLAGCGDCQARVTEAEAPIASFKAVSAAWGERRSATMPVQVSRSVKPLWHRPVSWVATAVAMAVVGIAIPLASHDAQSSTASNAVVPHPSAAAQAEADAQAAAKPVTLEPAEVHEVATVSAAHPRTAQIERDNEMLQAIDRELDASVQSPAVTFGLDNVGSRSVGRIHAPATQKWID